MLYMERPRKFVKVRVRNSANNETREKHQANCPKWKVCKGVKETFERVRGILQKEEKGNEKCKNDTVSERMIQFEGPGKLARAICLRKRTASE